MAEIICIVCPKSCRLHAEGDTVTGNACARGGVYGRGELLNPVRVVTSTVRITGAAHPRIPVKTKSAIPKRLVFDAVRLLDAVEIKSPAGEGQVVVEDICGTGIPWVTTRGL
ncbi:MAG: DUF1667 domain-containing protein [Oscillospiraceae bacterium]|jgi:CxxC motif-containing protein|nr:DUF1667 domain-containing protein [Oscillospiraceae bacterium]